jgi:tetratricopeptide (TPR) repeat protein
LALPISFKQASTGPSNQECAQLADRPPTESGVSLTALEACATLLQDDVELLADLGQAYESASRGADAEAVYHRILSRDSNYGDIEGRLARLLLKRGAADEARPHIEAALRIQPHRREWMALETLIAEVQRRGR